MMFLLWAAGAALVLLGGRMGLGRWKQRRALARLEATARTLELRPTPRRRAFEGELFRVPVEVTAGEGVRLRARVEAPLPPALHLQAQVGELKQRLRHLQDIQVGDPALDAAWLIQGRNPAAVIDLLRSAPVRDGLVGLISAFPDARLSGGELSVTVPRADPQELKGALQQLCGVAASLRDAAKTLEVRRGERMALARAEAAPLGEGRRFIALERPEAVAAPEVIAAFAKVTTTSMFLNVCTVALLATWRVFFRRFPGFGLVTVGQKVITCLAAGTAAVALVYSLLYVRCPVCGAAAWTGKDWYQRTHCTRCGIRLRPS